MVVYELAEEFSSPVVGVEVHVKCIDVAAAMIDDNDGGAGGADGLAGTIRPYAVEPGWIGGYVVERGEIDIRSIVSVEDVQIVESQRRGNTVHDNKVVLWPGVDELSAQIAGHVRFV